MKNIVCICSILLLLLVGCKLSETVATSDPSDFITISSLSTTLEKITAGEAVTVYYGFSASEYITQNDVNITIKNENGVEVTEQFDVTISPFSEKVTTVEDKKCSVTVETNLLSADGIYTVYLDITLGSKKDSKKFILSVGTVSLTSIQSVTSLSMLTGAKDTLKATVLNGSYLTKEDFSVVVNGSGAKPEATTLSYDNGLLLIEVFAGSAPMGIFNGAVSIPALSVSKEFSLSIVDVLPAQIVSIESVSITEGESTTTKASIANGEKLTVDDFEVTIDENSNTESMPPVVLVTAYASGTATIAVDASTADPGTYYGTLRLDGSAESFTITIQEAGSVEISSSESVLRVVKGESIDFDLTVEASSVITRDSITYRIVDSDNTPYEKITLSLPSFSAKSKTLTATMSIEPDCAGTYYLHVYAQNGAVTDSVEIRISALHKHPTVDSVGNVWVNEGDLESGRADISQNGHKLILPDFTLSVASNGSGTPPTATITAFTHRTVSFLVDAKGATAGEYTGTLSLRENSMDFTITVRGGAPSLDSVGDVEVMEGQMVYALGSVTNAHAASLSGFSAYIVDAGVDAPKLTVSELSFGYIKVEVNAEYANPGIYEGRVSFRGVLKPFTITVLEKN